MGQGFWARIVTILVEWVVPWTTREHHLDLKIYYNNFLAVAIRCIKKWGRIFCFTQRQYFILTPEDTEKIEHH